MLKPAIDFCRSGSATLFAPRLPAECPQGMAREEPWENRGCRLSTGSRPKVQVNLKFHRRGTNFGWAAGSACLALFGNPWGRIEDNSGLIGSSLLLKRQLSQAA